MTANWRRYRPAIWLMMLGVALVLVLNPAYVGGAVLGAGIGVGLRIWRRQRTRGPRRSAGTRPPGG
jgi:hypothetical protein